MKVIAEIYIIPLGVGLSLSPYIAECERILKNYHLTIHLHAEGTNIEGELTDVLQAIEACIKEIHAMQVPRLMTQVKINSRTDRTETMQEKISSVEGKI